MAKISKPKKLKMPKRPRASASIAVWERFDARCKDVGKNNAAREAAYKKAVSQKESDRKKKEAIVKKYQGK